MDQRTQSLSKVAPQSRIYVKSRTISLSGVALNWSHKPTAGQDMCHQRGHFDCQITYAESLCDFSSSSVSSDDPPVVLDGSSSCPFCPDSFCSDGAREA